MFTFKTIIETNKENDILDKLFFATSKKSHNFQKASNSNKIKIYNN